MAVESEEGDIDLLNDETFGDGAVGKCGGVGKAKGGTASD